MRRLTVLPGAAGALALLVAACGQPEDAPAVAPTPAAPAEVATPAAPPPAPAVNTPSPTMEEMDHSKMDEMDHSKM